MNQVFSIAIDGPSGAGKSTIARAVAEKTGAVYLDTGAMYRAIGLYMLENNIDPHDEQSVGDALDAVAIDVSHVAGVQRIYLNQRDVSEAIRTPAVALAASAVSAVTAVRARLVAMQRALAEGKSVVMDGRDIGTKVLPHATVKVFLTADLEKRARRRQTELTAKGAPADFEQVYREMAQRDHADSTRAASPLTRAPDATEVDSSDLTPDEVCEKVLALLKEALRR